MELAPIVLFVYNRPWHTEKTLFALQSNVLANQSVLYVYCDGPKVSATTEDLKNIDSVRRIVKQNTWCKKVIVMERDNNLGLAKSVIQGVSEVIEKHDNVIVLEDDIVTSTYFLTYMNDALNMYRANQDVFGISGYSFFSSKKVNKDTYFLPIMSSWGYATWADRWRTVNFNGLECLKKVQENKIFNKLDFGNIKYYQMLVDQTKGRNDSWAVLFYISMFLQHKLFLYPKYSLLKNIGFDGSGVHYDVNLNFVKANFKIYNSKIKMDKQPVVLDQSVVKKVKNHLQASTKKSTLNKNYIKNKIASYLAPEIKTFLKRKFKIKSPNDFSFLNQIPRYKKTSISLNNQEITIPDSASFLFMYNEIFKTQIYKFETESKKPYIIDGGANIGLATIYFKILYPNSNVVAFEPDPDIFNILESNIKTYNFKDVDLVNKGLWSEETVLKFQSEGADAGLLHAFDKSDNSNLKSVAVTSLKPYLQKTVDFLKLDIEGAETNVLKNIANDLDKVRCIFVEYHSYAEQDQTLDQIINILKQSNFRLYISSPGVSSKSPFVDLKVYKGMDMQLNIYGFKKDK